MLVTNADNIRGKLAIKIVIGTDDSLLKWTGQLHARLVKLRISHELKILNPMKKIQIIAKIIDCLSESLRVLETAARASHAEATHESSKAENKYDTRGLEAAYLAGGQARQATMIQDAIQVYRSLVVRYFAAAEAINLTALVELDTDGTRSLYFMGPTSGGLEVVVQRKEITVITPQSPLGQNLMGRKTGQRWTTRVGGRTAKYQVISVV